MRVGRVVFDGPPKKMDAAAAAVAAAYRKQAEQERERAEAYKRLLAEVYSYCARDIEAYAGAELLREVQDAIGQPSESDL